MTSFFSRFRPVPTFPAYTGPYVVGTRDIEIPVADLPSSSPPPNANISTVSFRLFYPCEPCKHAKPVYWLPDPQSQFFRAYARFLNAGHKLAAFLSYLPIFQTIFYTTIPANRDAKVATPPTNIERWPVMVFSHGLGGSRNAYSQISGSIASYGLVVVAAEHRDGSAPISFVRDKDKIASKAIEYRHVPYKVTAETEEIRTEQMNIRLWELTMIHAALIELDNGSMITNLASDSGSTLGHDFHSILDVHTPGKIAWAGHSFGAATMIQFVKSMYYSRPTAEGDESMHSVPNGSPTERQITPASPVILLDLWALPLQISSASSLLAKPLPAYDTEGGSPPLAILSEAFYKWKSNLEDTRKAISPHPGCKSSIRPNIFYPTASAHLSQSDFGPLFPWLTKKVFKAEEPERTLRLNVRAILESLRRCGIRVADTSAVDIGIKNSDDSHGCVTRGDQVYPLGQDHRILAVDGNIEGWVSVPTMEQDGTSANGSKCDAKYPSEAVMNGEVMKE